MGIFNRIIRIASSYAQKSTQSNSSNRTTPIQPPKKMNSTIDNDPLAREINSLHSKQNHQQKNTQKEQPKAEQKPNQKLTRKEALSILNIQFDNPSQDQIKSAYKRLLMLHHPDRVQHLSANEQKIAEQKTILINLAYSTLI
jgi:hypothetical protein